MILVETSGVIDEIIPSLELCCEGDWARSVEIRLRLSIFHYDNIPDDMVVDPRITYQENVTGDFYGLELIEHIGDTGRGAGSRRWDPPIKDIERALDLLRPRQWSWDKTAGEAERSILEDVFAGILPVEKRGWYWWSTGMTENLIKLIGLEQMMYAMLDYPEAMHRLMAFLRDDMQGMLDWYERQGLLLPNNEDDYVYLSLSVAHHLSIWPCVLWLLRTAGEQMAVHSPNSKPSAGLSFSLGQPGNDGRIPWQGLCIQPQTQPRIGKHESMG